MIRKAELKDLKELTRLGMQLWPDNVFEELEAEFSETMETPEAAFFLALDGGKPIGFAQCRLRHDYVEGTETSPVGYLEGIYVAEGYRRQGTAKKLLAACEEWAKGTGCREFASDCELDNTESLYFHLKMGFAEANRIICFTKRLAE